MWRRAYLMLVIVRLYFALSLTYLHPDENFQGPEPIAGKFLDYLAKLDCSSILSEAWWELKLAFYNLFHAGSMAS